jgi:ABC-type antimicrobial peptide transport system permease subunit
VLRQALAVTAGGVVAGVVGSLALSQTIATLLYGVDRFDPVTYTAVPVLLLMVALAACIGPARRAARLDPLHLLKGV